MCCQGNGLLLTIGESEKEDEISFQGFLQTAELVEEDIVACNSVIHIIDTVLISEEIAQGVDAMKIQMQGVPESKEKKGKPKREKDRRRTEEVDVIEEELEVDDEEGIDITETEQLDIEGNTAVDRKSKRMKKNAGENGSDGVAVVAQASELPPEILKVVSQVEDAEKAKQKENKKSKKSADCDTVWKIIEQRPELSSLKKSVKHVNFQNIVNDPDLAATFFAPTNEAFKVNAISWPFWTLYCNYGCISIHIRAHKVFPS